MNQLNETGQKQLNELIDERNNDSIVLNKPYLAGIKKSLTDGLYPDQAHFIYELLQNAEDTKATEAYFKLSRKNLEFGHNGKKLFEFNNIEAIVSIPDESIKKSDPTSIGKFGVGFKAVFSYTSTPQIYSNGFNIEIFNFFQLKEIEKVKQRFETIFLLPFNNIKKPISDAFNQIETVLIGLNENALLFLSNIKKISYEIEEDGYDNKKGSIVLEEIHTYITRIVQKKSQETDSSTLWLKFEKNETIKNEQGTLVSCALAIAYSVQEKINKITNKEDLTVDKKYEIVPIKQSHVFIYFPAIKETSNLKFHIHAPFASTVARDSVRDCDENHRLRDGIATLVCESISKIKELGLLTANFLSVLPNKEDKLATFYEPIWQAVLDEFKAKPLLPMQNGQFGIASDVYTGERAISNVIGDADLAFLTLKNGQTNSGAALWVDNLNAQNHRVNQFIADLGVTKWRVDELVTTISELDKPLVIEGSINLIEAFNRWLSSKDDSWLMSFYNIIGAHHKAKNKYLFTINNLAFIKARLHDDSSQTFFKKPNEVYLSVDCDIKKPAYVVVLGQPVKNAGVSDNNKDFSKDQKNENIENFYKSLNIKTFDWRESISDRLKNPGKLFSDFDSPDYYGFVGECINYYQDTKKIDIFKNQKMFYAIRNHKIEWVSADQVFISEPYIDNSFSKINHFKNNKYLLSDKYKSYFDSQGESKVRDDFLELLKALGATWQLILEHKKSKQYADIQEYYELENLDNIILNINIDSSKLVWYFLSSSTEKYHIHYYKYKTTDQFKEKDSEIVNTLSSKEWLPNPQGEFFKPCDIDESGLHSDFKIDQNNSQFNAFLKAINFAGKTKQKIAEEKDLNKIAEAAGYKSIDQMRIDRELCENLTDDQKAKLLAEISQKTEFPSHVSPNPALRSQRATEDARNAPDRKYEPSLSSRNTSRTPEQKAASRQYLKGSYTNVNGCLYCQCCNNEMPFKLNGGEGEYYFADVQITKSTKEHTNYRLALCPTCAAMYRHANDQTEEAIQAKLLVCKLEQGAGDAAIDIQLAGKPRQLRFVENHLIDVQAILKAGV